MNSTVNSTLNQNGNKARRVWTKVLVTSATLAILAFVPALSGAAFAAGKGGGGAAAAPAAAPAASPAASADSDGPTGVVNLNTATEDELTLLPGVGPSKAQAILAWRQKYGAFKKVDDLTKVKGFGHKTMKKLKPFLAIAGATTYKGKKNRVATEESP
jgi:competence protein ComEA